jgi:hypothetical protein
MVRGSPIEGTLYATTAPVQDVGVDHRRPDVFVAEEFLDGADVVADLEQVSREAVPQRMNCGVLGDPSGSAASLNSRWTTVSCTWWRRLCPVTRSM